VAGTIEVNRPIHVASNTYIAGQTAPGDGVQIKLGASHATPLLIVNAHDVLVRFLKVRPGPSRQPSSSVDGVTIASSNAIYLDHLSVQFATDENVSVHTDGRPTRDITISHTIVAWGLDHANHPKGKHSKGALICSHGAIPASPCGRISLIQNLFAHNRDRNPDVKATDVGPIEVINNVFYDPKSQFAEIYNIIGDTRISYVGNVALTGPSTRRSRRPPALEAFARNPDHVLEIFADDNLYGPRSGCRVIRRLPAIGRGARRFLVDHPAEPLTHEPMPASQTYEYVLNAVGARLPNGRFRDRLDRMLTDSVRTCSGEVIDSVDEIGGWPEWRASEKFDDTDRDGMPDAWEAERSGLDPYDMGDAWLDRDGDGWSNLEEYLSVVAGDLKEQ